MEHPAALARRMRMRWSHVLAGATLAVSVLGCGVPGPAAPSPSVDGSPASPPPAGAGPGLTVIGDVRYTCGGPGFSPAVFDQPAIAETEAHPSAVALRAAIAQVGLDIDMLPEAGYRLAYRDDLRATYLAGDPADGLIYAEFAVDGGEWRLQGWGGCRPEIVVDGLSLATWVLAQGLPVPDAATTQVTALVTERACTGATPMGGRLQPPRIASSDAAVIVVFAAVPLKGDMFTCPGNPSARVTFELPAPLGDRQLLDGAFFPPAEPVEPAS